MPAHKIAKYKDGYVWVEYCEICGKEGSLLAEECEPEKKDDKIVDKAKERS